MMTKETKKISWRNEEDLHGNELGVETVSNVEAIHQHSEQAHGKNLTEEAESPSSENPRTEEIDNEDNDNLPKEAEAISETELPREENKTGNDKKKSKLKTLLFFVIAGLIAGGVGIVYLKFGSQLVPNLVTFGSTQEEQSGFSLYQGELKKFQLEFETFRDQVNQMNISETLTKVQEDLQMQKTIQNDFERSIQRQVDILIQESDASVKEIAEMRSLVNSIDSNQRLSDDDKEKIGLRLLELEKKQENAITNFKKALQEELSKLPKSNRKSTGNLTSNTSTTKTRTQTKPPKDLPKTNPDSVMKLERIANLQLTNTTSFGSQWVASLSSGTLGALQMIEGERLGDYIIIKIDAEGMTVRDHTGKKYFIEVKG
ncbi:hypothetical protein ACPV5U_24510 [Vibrio mediterranei]